MKKSLKIFTTVTSMLLSLSVMVFGVFALTTNTYIDVHNDIEFQIGTDENPVDVIFALDYYQIKEDKTLTNTLGDRNGEKLSYNLELAFEKDDKVYIGYVVEIDATEGPNNFGSDIKYSFDNLPAQDGLEIYLVDGEASSLDFNNLTALTLTSSILHGEATTKTFSVVIFIEINTTINGQQATEAGFKVVASKV